MPRNFEINETCLRFRYPKLARSFIALHSIPERFMNSHDFLHWNCRSVPRAADRPPFYVSISDIVSIRPNEQMARVGARRIIALMTNDMAFWNLAASQKLIRVAMSANIGEFRVAVFISTTSPPPARISILWDNELHDKAPMARSSMPSAIRATLSYKWACLGDRFHGVQSHRFMRECQ